MKTTSREESEKKVYAEALRQAAQDYEELVGELSILRLLNDSLQAGLGFNDICQKLVEFLTEAMDVENASIMVMDREKKQLRLLVGKNFYEDEGTVYTGRQWTGKTFKLGEGIAGQVAKGRKSVLVHDTHTDPRFVSAEGQKVTVRSMLSLPLIHGERLHGVLNLSNSEPGAFNSRNEHAMNIIASTASVALSHAIVAEELKQSNTELTARNRELAAVNALSEALHSNLDLDTVLSESLKNISDGFDIEAAAVFIEDSETGAVSLRSYTARSVDTAPIQLLQSLGERIGREVMALKNSGPYIGPVDEMRREEAHRRKLLACVGVPLFMGENCFGMLVILISHDTRAMEAEAELLSSFCRQISVAVHNSILVSQLKENIAELQETRQRLIQSDKLALLGEMVSGVAHELNNPLAAILGYNELLLDDKTVSERGKTMLKRTISCVDRSRKIVQGLLSFARKAELEKKPANINDIIGKVLAHRDYDLVVNNIEVIKNFEVDEPIIVVDSNQMEQVFLNLLNNAFDSMAGRDVPGILEVRTTLIEGDTIQIEFIDNGCGVKESDKAKLFEPFFTTKETGRGTGLGLSVSLGIIKEHGGDLYLDEAHCCGAKFVITLPLVSTHESAEERAAQKESFAQPKAHGRILVVDDEDVVTDVVRTALSSSGFSVDCASGGEEAYRMVGSKAYDLIISDIRMPGAMDGRRFFYEVKKNDPALADRFVFISGDVMEKKTARFLKESGRAFLLKPFSMSDLRWVVEKTLQGIHS